MKGIVVDASVAHAAGDSDVPVSLNCRTFLDAMRKATDCVCVLSPELREEWTRHCSIFSTNWLATMISRRRVIERAPSSDNGLCERLVQCAGNIAAHEPVQTRAVAAALCKDAHLLDAALASPEDGGRIVSLDEKVRRHLRVCAKSDPSIGEVVWVNPGLNRGQTLRYPDGQR